MAGVDVGTNNGSIGRVNVGRMQNDDSRVISSSIMIMEWEEEKAKRGKGLMIWNSIRCATNGKLCSFVSLRTSNDQVTINNQKGGRRSTLVPNPPAFLIYLPSYGLMVL